jgi:hypothetical protein
MMEEIDEMDGEMAVEALREIQRVCESYKGRVPQKAAESSGEEMPEEAIDELAEDFSGEEPALEIEISAEPSEPEEPPPRRFVDYGGPSRPREKPAQPPLPQKRGPGRPRKVR